MFNAIRKRLAEFSTLSKHEEHHTDTKVNQNKIRLSEIDKEIEDLLSKMVYANTVLMKYINNRVAALDTERRQLQEENNFLAQQPDSSSLSVISDHVQKWEETTFEDKQSIVDALIKIITIADGNIEITWNI